MVPVAEAKLKVIIQEPEIVMQLKQILYILSRSLKRNLEMGLLHEQVSPLELGTLLGMCFVTVFTGLKTFPSHLQICVDCCLSAQGPCNGFLERGFLFFVLIMTM